MESPPAGRYGLQVPECTARQVAAGWSQRALCGTLGNVVYLRRGAWQARGGAGREADYNSRQAVRCGGAGGSSCGRSPAIVATCVSRRGHGQPLLWVCAQVRRLQEGGKCRDKQAAAGCHPPSSACLLKIKQLIN